jgi:uncharacterized membrane protein YedE/YeeE
MEGEEPVPEPLVKLVLGLLTGLIFGVLLQKGGVTKYEVIVGQFRLRDFTVLKVMLTAVVVGGAGVYALKALGLAALHVKPAQMAAVPIGGLIFGTGMALLGYCPGTGVAAAAEGHRDALFGVIGMMAGALIFAEQFALLNRSVLAWANLGPITWPEVTSMPPALLLAILAALAYILFRQIGSWEKAQSRKQQVP